METKEKEYYIGFFKFDDTQIWQKTNLYIDEKELTDYMNNIPYIDKTTIHIKLINLPN